MIKSIVIKLPLDFTVFFVYFKVVAHNEPHLDWIRSFSQVEYLRTDGKSTRDKQPLSSTSLPPYLISLVYENDTFIVH